MKKEMQEVCFSDSHSPLSLRMLCVFILTLLSGEFALLRADANLGGLAVPMSGVSVGVTMPTVSTSNFRKNSYSHSFGSARSYSSQTYSSQPMRKGVGSSNYSNGSSYISKAGKIIYQTSTADLHSSNASAMSYSAGSYSHSGSRKSYSSTSYAGVSLPSVSSTAFSWKSKINTDEALTAGPRKVIRPDISKTEGGKTYYWEDEDEEWVVANNPDGDTSKDGDYPGQISADGNYSWNGTQWVDISGQTAETNNPIGNLPVWMMLLCMMAYSVIRFRHRLARRK